MAATAMTAACPADRFEEISDNSLHRSAARAGLLDAVLAVRQATSRRLLWADPW
jgi:hypothetical protein